MLRNQPNPSDRIRTMSLHSTVDLTSCNSCVTVILPTSGRTSYLREAIDSIQKQSFTHFVVLVGDNGQSDTCAAIVRATGDSRFKYIRHPVNLGAQGNWLELIRLAQTPLIATLHDDDAWHPDFLRQLVSPMLANSKIAMSFGDYIMINQDGVELTDQTIELSHQTHRDVMPGGPMQLSLEDGLRLIAVWNAPSPAICAVVRRQEILDTEFPPAASPLYDLWLDYQLVKRRALLHFVPGKHTNYRIHPASATSKGYATPEDFIFSTIISENSSAGPVLDEIRHYWAQIRWGRAVKKMNSDETRNLSQEEFRAAAPCQQNPVKRLLATLAGHSNAAWTLMRLARSLKPKR